ncbi:DNA polymerase IV [Candidatus Sumerlaeota bacterium]|nr:DNA polymerase IV [Candidatus Sumerlaeota bacterium]
MHRNRIVLHVDMDSFFVEVERLNDSSLIGKPVIVGGSPESRGVVCSASYEARRSGVRSAMPMARAMRLCPAAVVVRVGTSDYGHYSRQVRETLQSFSPLVEMQSIDEGYLDLTGAERIHGSPMQTAQKLRDAIWERVRLPSSCGAGPNKLVAKVASACCKPRGMLWIPHGGEAEFFAPLPIRRLPGIGPSLAAQLEAMRIRILGDLQRAGLERLCEALGGMAGAELFERAHGRSQSPVCPEREAKSVSKETTFHRDVADRDTLEAALSRHCEHVAHRLREIGCRAHTIQLKLRYADFRTITRSMHFDSATDNDREIYRAVKDLLIKELSPNARIRLIGASASGLTDAQWQLDFLDEERREKNRRLDQALDNIKERHGFQSILWSESKKTNEKNGK